MDTFLRIFHILRILLLLSCSLSELQGQRLPNLSYNPCAAASSCSKCIARHPSCAWCSKENGYVEPGTRCHLITQLEQRLCSSELVEYPENMMTLSINKPITDKSTPIQNTIQFTPQELQLTLRPNSPQSISMNFRAEYDQPLDLYYLVDLSQSMENDREKLVALGILLAKHLPNITQNFRLGFGSFGTKVRKPCLNCSDEISFRNHLSLTIDENKFVEVMHTMHVSSRSLPPDGGPDAVMQAIICWEELGWRLKSRKIIVFASNSDFQLGGNGTLRGDIFPNDGQCYMDNGYFQPSTLMDFPSLDQLRRELAKKKVTTIFAVTADKLPAYQELNKNIGIGTTFTGQLEVDSSNIVDILKEQDNKTYSEVELGDDAPRDVKIAYFSKCLGNASRKTNKCTDLKPGEQVAFIADIQLTSCPRNPKLWKTNFTIAPIGVSEALTVHLDMICQCGCEKEKEINNWRCSSQGTYQCGICICNYGYIGRFCECDMRHEPMEESSCNAPDSNLVCSSRGMCTCGNCACHMRVTPSEVISGTFCECTNYDCDRHNGRLCGGHGKCVCNKCICDEGWEGSSCICSKDNQNCLTANGKICDNHGFCRCGSCHCSQGYTGTTCEVELARKTPIKGDFSLVGSVENMYHALKFFSNMFENFFWK